VIAFEEGLGFLPQNWLHAFDYDTSSSSSSSHSTCCGATQPELSSPGSVDSSTGCEIISLSINCLICFSMRSEHSQYSRDKLVLAILILIVKILILAILIVKILTLVVLLVLKHYEIL